MEVCSSCQCFSSCSESRYSIDFIRRLMIVSSVISDKIIYITHKDEAEELGYSLDNLLSFIEKNKNECFFFSTEQSGLENLSLQKIYS